MATKILSISAALTGHPAPSPECSNVVTSIIPRLKQKKHVATSKREALTWELISSTLKTPPPKGAPHRYLTDPSTPGFGVYITSAGLGAYYVECKERQLDGIWKRVRVAGWKRVGTHDRDRDGKAEVVQARREATDLLTKAARGEPIAKSTIEAWARVMPVTGSAFTYRAAYQAYCQKAGRKGKPLRPATLETYERCFEYLSEWHDLVLWTITKKMAADVMVRLQKKHGPIAANMGLGFFRSVWEWHAADLAEPLPCPTSAFGKKNLWTRPQRRQGKIEERLTSEWWAAVHSMPGKLNHYGQPWWQPVDVVYFLSLLLTGARRTELLHARWKHYKPATGEWFFPGTDAEHYDEKARQWKATGGRRYVGNKSDRDHTVYVGPVLAKLLLEHRATQSAECKYIFATPADRLLAEDRADNALEAFRQVYPQMKRWSCHTLRHTFLTVAYELGVGLKELKLLVNHEADNADVTLGYIHPEKLRAHGAAVEAEILRRAGVAQ